MPFLDVWTLLAKAVILLVGFPIHELAHAWTAYKLGDPTAQRMGRLTLNPLAHLDPLGSLLLLVSFIGWAKPVPVNEHNLRNPRWGGALVSLAGPLSNLLMAALLAVPYRMGLFAGLPRGVHQFVFVFVGINVLLCVFNLIPLAPLDGFRVLSGVMGRAGGELMRILGTYGPLILLGLFMLGYISPQLNFLGRWLGAAMGLVDRFLLG
ncbi:MAG: Peptidase family M50 [Chloroflexi bacterium ADurb.Bin325]|nr:MAG: Peptidase family M50 [Chloroflexi bacterium ADurb.Bin325]